ncbi:hypothetical protein B0P06_000172 [Clostridium saccharoperbutylacetonicum]|nr:DUF1016 N-terminal domain-containing protein [Clostridium saccharoperbutylacetonicum]NRT63554.1 hypothetical protein [Clostridium saccharoperbutylacetonicum]NSB26917.1 hypothetical protein [Clostridium saccharoperbutylacetonicum]NSB40401.1 hypothetical protein [Clostridium saccharoperbutylacetonicum]
MNNENIKLLYKEIVNVIDNSKKNVVMAVNSEMVILYWNIGKIIKTEILQSEKAEYGKSVISDLSKELTNEYGKGYSQANLFNMVRLYDTIQESEILQTLSVKLTWSHLLKLITIDDDLKRDFYTPMCINEHWSVRTLTDRINSILKEAPIHIHS